MNRVRCLVFNAALGPLDYRVPDGMAVEPGSVTIAKTETGKLTKLQEITIQKIRDAKGQAFKVTSAAEVAAILKLMEVISHE